MDWDCGETFGGKWERLARATVICSGYAKKLEEDYSEIYIEIVEGYSSINGWLNEFQTDWEKTGEFKMDISEVMVGAGKGYKIRVIELETGTIIVDEKIVLFHKGNIFILYQEAPTECRNLECHIFNQMLSTFRFLE
jgi:hypothetical protein